MADPTLYEEQNLPAKHAITLDPTKEQEEFSSQRNTFAPMPEKAKEILSFISRRKENMHGGRPDGKWELRMKQFVAALVYRQDGLANVNLPIEKVTIRNKMADMESMESVVNLIPVEPDDIYKRGLIKPILDIVDLEMNFKREKTKWIQGGLIFGTGWWFEGVKRETFTKFDPEMGENGEIIPIARTITRSWLQGEAKDIRDILVDPVPDIELAADCGMYERNFSYENIKGLLEDPNYNHDEVRRYLASISPTTSSGQNTWSSAPFLTHSDVIADGNSDKYTLFHYWNKEKGIYVVTDERQEFLLRYGAMPFAHGELPITPFVDHMRSLELYGEGECELLESTKYERNMLRNQMLDGVRASNTTSVAVGGGLAFDQSELVEGSMRVFNFTGDLSQMQYLKPPSLDNTIFSMEEILRTDATWETGIDNNSLAGSPTKTALEARLQENTKLKGVGVTMRNLDYALERIYRQRLANIQQFLPYTTGKKILGKKKADELGFRTMAFENMKREDIMGFDKGYKNLELKGVNLKKKDGNVEFLELSPSLIRNSFDIRVTTPTTTPILRELDRGDLNDILKSTMELAQSGSPEAQAAIKSLKYEKILREKFIQAGFDPDEYLGEESDKVEERKKIRGEVLKDIPKVPRYAADPQPTNVGYGMKEQEMTDPGITMPPMPTLPPEPIPA